MFDTTKASRTFSADEIKIIDDFFDQLKWDVTSMNPKVPEVQYGTLM